MLNAVFFLSDNYAHFKNDETINADSIVFLSFLCDAGNNETLSEAYRFFSESNIVDFSLSFKITGALNSLFIEDIISFFFISTYFKSNGQPLLNIVCSEGGLFENTKRNINDIACKQGFMEIKINQLTEKSEDEMQNVLNESYLFTDSASLLEQYKNVLQSEKFYGNAFYLNDTSNDPGKLYLSIQQEEYEAEKAHPQLFKMGHIVQSVVAENEYLSIKCRYMATELDNYKAHNEILRSSSEATELQHYYNKEYEVLPLWYKRVGHLIKVLTGKRKLSSLFGDDQKKQQT